MKILFSWLKRTVEDADRVSSAASMLFCFILFAGTIAFAGAVARQPIPEESAEFSETPISRVVFRSEDFHIAPQEAEIESVPEETPPAPEIPAPAEEIEKEEPPKPEKIEDDALREISEPPPEEIEVEEPEKQEDPPREIPEEDPPLPPQEAAPPDLAPPPADVPVVEQPTPEQQAARAAAEQTLYGYLASAIREKKFYPKAARRMGKVGTVFMRVEISEQGKIAGVSVKSSSAHHSLEEGAVKTLARVAEDFSAPESLREALPAVFIVPVEYELQ